MTNTQKLQNRHILSLMGVHLWVQRGTSLTDIGKIPSRFDGKLSKNSLGSKNPVVPQHSPAKTLTKPTKLVQKNLDKAAVEPNKIFEDSKKHAQNITPSTPKQTVVVQEDFENDLSSLKDDELRFNLEGFKAGNYIVMVEKTLLGKAESDTWERLKKNLRQQTSIAEHQDSFPISEYQTSECAVIVFYGFLFGLKMALDKLTSNVDDGLYNSNIHDNTLIFLTPLPKVIKSMKDFTFVCDFSLQKMSGTDQAAAQQKKDLWNLITNNSKRLA